MKIGNVMFVTVFAAMLGTPAVLHAQQRPPAAEKTAAGATGYLELVDMDVVTPNGDEIGEVEEALMDSSGKVVAVAVEVGGFLGVGDSDVVMQLDQLRLENKQLVTALTKEQIEALPKWDD